MENMNMNSEVVETPKKANGLAITGLVLGILAFPISCCYGIGTIFAIVGLILSIIGMKKQKGGLATAALIVNIIALIFGIIMVVYYVVVIVAMVQSGEFQAIWDEAMNGAYYY